MQERIIKIWKDPVWSGVIRKIIIVLGAIIFLPITEWLLQRIYEALKHELAISIWLFLIIAIVPAIFVHLINKLWNRKNNKWRREYLSLIKREPGKYWDLIFRALTEENGWEKYGKRIPPNIIAYFYKAEKIIEPSGWEIRPYFFTDKGDHFVKIYLNDKYPEN